MPQSMKDKFSRFQSLRVASVQDLEVSRSDLKVSGCEGLKVSRSHIVSNYEDLNVARSQGFKVSNHGGQSLKVSTSQGCKRQRKRKRTRKQEMKR